MSEPLTHRHDWLTWATFHHAPTDAGHTMFMVFACQCPGCHAVSVFPRGAYERCTATFKAQFVTATTAAGWRLDDDEDPALGWQTMNDPDGRNSIVGSPRRPTP